MPQENGWATGPEHCDNDGRICPYCGSENTDTGCDETKPGQIVEMGCECLDCGKTWDNLYNIAGWYHTDEDGDDTLHEDLRDFNTREHVKILRRALQKAYSGLDSAACYFDNQDSPSVVHVVDEALGEARAALEATKEGV